MFGAPNFALFNLTTPQSKSSLGLKKLPKN